MYELPQVKQAIKETCPNLDVKVMVVLCNKRVNQRFFHNENGRLSNPQPGTCIDSDIVNHDTYDFYMISQ